MRATAQAASEVSTARSRMPEARYPSAADRSDIFADLADVGHKMAQQILYAMFERRGR